MIFITFSAQDLADASVERQRCLTFVLFSKKMKCDAGLGELQQKGITLGFGCFCSSKWDRKEIKVTISLLVPYRVFTSFYSLCIV